MFLSCIREATRAFHVQLEHDLDIFHTVTTLESYTRLLQKFLSFYMPVETQLLDIQSRYDLQINLQHRLKSPLLLRDLSEIAPRQSTVSPCGALPTLSCPAQVWGCLYVLEGSTLGGTIIARHIKNALGLTAEHGCAFFCSYGSEVGSMWQLFARKLEAHVSRYHEERMIIDAACETFAVLSQWLLKE